MNEDISPETDERLLDAAVVTDALKVSPAPPTSARRTLIVGSALLAGQPFLLNALSLFAIGYIIRTLGPSEYGRWATAASLSGATSMLASLGLRPLFVRALAEHPAHRRVLLSEQMAVRLILGSVAGMCSLAAAVALGYSTAVVTCAAVFGVALALTSLWSVLGDYLQAHERFREFSAVTFVAGVTLTALSVLVVWLGGRAISLAGAYLAGPLVTVCGFAILLHRSGELVSPRVSWKRGKALLAKSRSIAGAQLIASFRDRGEQLLLPKVVGVGSFGVFAGSVMPADRLNGLADAIGTAFYPRLSRSSGSERQEYAMQLVAGALVLAAGAGALLYLAAPLLATVLFAGQRATATAIMRVTSLGLPAAACGSALTFVFQATGRHRVAAHLSIWSSIASLALTTAFVLSWGSYGAAWAWTARQYVMAGMLVAPIVVMPRVMPFPVFRLAVSMAVLALVTWVLSDLEIGVFSLMWKSASITLLFISVLALLRVLPGVARFSKREPRAVTTST